MARQRIDRSVRAVLSECVQEAEARGRQRGTWGPSPRGATVDRVPDGASRAPGQHDRAGGRGHGGGVRGHRDQPAVRDEGVVGRRGPDPRCRHDPGGRVPGVLGADPGGHDQVPDVHHARGQPRRGRGAGPARTAAGLPAQDGQGQGDVPRGADPDRRGPAVRRRGADPGDLGAVRGGGHRGAQPAPGITGRADHVRDPAGPVPGPVAGHPGAREGVRPGDDRLVHADRRPGPRRGAQGTHRRPGAAADVCVPDADRQRHPRVPAAGLDHPGRHGCGGAVRGHGALRVPADPAGVAVAGQACPGPGLPRAGGDRHQRAGGRGEPAVRAGPEPDLGPDHAGVRDDGHDHRLPGADHRGVLVDPPSRAARVLPPGAGDPHLRPGRGPDLHPGPELHADGRVHRPGPDVPVLGQPGRRLRGCRVRDDGHHLDRVLRGRGPHVGLDPAARGQPGGGVPGRRPVVPGRDPAQVPAGRVRADHDRCGRGGRDVRLAPRAEPAAQPRRGQPAVLGRRARRHRGRQHRPHAAAPGCSWPPTPTTSRRA